MIEKYKKIKKANKIDLIFLFTINYCCSPSKKTIEYPFKGLKKEKKNQNLPTN